ncbi:MAG: hypothetical protein ACRDFS_01685 [Chloroflexota bacterium]
MSDARNVGDDRIITPPTTPRPKYDLAGLIDHLVEAGHRAAVMVGGGPFRSMGRFAVHRPTGDPSDAGLSCSPMIECRLSRNYLSLGSPPGQ